MTRQTVGSPAVDEAVISTAGEMQAAAIFPGMDLLVSREFDDDDALAIRRARLGEDGGAVFAFGHHIAFELERNRAGNTGAARSAGEEPVDESAAAADTLAAP